MRLIYVISIFFGIVSYANADLLVKSPAEACVLLNEIGLTTNSWTKNEYDEEYGCFSSYKQIGSASPLANNLAVYFEGNNSTVTLSYLMMNVNDKTTAKAVHEELLKAANVLVSKQTGKTLSKKLTAAITSGSNLSEKIGNTTVDVIRENWVTGRGYEVKVTVK